MKFRRLLENIRCLLEHITNFTVIDDPRKQMGHIPWLTKQRMKMVFWFFHDHGRWANLLKKVKFVLETSGSLIYKL